MAEENGGQRMSDKKEITLPEIVVERHPGGRPSKYDPAYCEMAKELGRQGKSRAQIAAYFDMSRQGLAGWEKAYPEFLDAMTLASEYALSWWETAGQTGMFMQNFSANAYSLQIRNRFPADYRDAKIIGGDPGNPVKIEVQEADAFRSRIASLAARAGEDEGAGEPH